MAYDYAKLNGRIAEKCGSQGAFAKKDWAFGKNRFSKAQQQNCLEAIGNTKGNFRS